MISLINYLKAVLCGAKSKSQKKNDQAEEDRTKEDKPGFIEDIKAWRETERCCRKTLRNELPGKIEQKFEKTKSFLKEKKSRQKEKCETKNWKWLYHFLIAISYWGKLTVARIVFLPVLISILIIYHFVVATAWLVVWIFFLAHWALRIVLVPLLVGVFIAVLLGVVYLVYSQYGILLGSIEGGSSKTGVAVSSLIIIPFVILGIIISSNNAEKIAGEVIGEIAVKILVKITLKIMRKILYFTKNLADGFWELCSLPKIKLVEAFKDTKKTLKDIGNAMAAISGLWALLFIVGLLGALGASANKVMQSVSVNTTVVHNDIHLKFENTVPLIASGPDGKNDKSAFFATMVSFSDEANVKHWLKGEYEKDCPDSQDSQKAPNFNSCAVKPDKYFYRSTLHSFLKGLSACGKPEGKVVLQTFGFSSASGVLSSLKNGSIEKRDIKEKFEKEKKEGGGESCYERTKGDGHQKLSNAFNLCMGELRARNVADMLKEIIASDKMLPADHIEVKPHQWGSYSQMCRQRGFSDTREEGEIRCYDRDLGLMNRRVEIWVTELSGCLNFSPADGAHPAEEEAQIPLSFRGKTCSNANHPPCEKGRE